jgi:Protein of unknown function (DUF1097)
MSLLTALAVSLGVLGGIATWLFLGPLGVFSLQIWAAFIAWGCFFHSGGKDSGLSQTIAANIAGAVIAGIALLIVVSTGLADSIGLPVWAGICVGIGVAAMCLLANVPMFSSIPGQVYGFAATAGYALLSNKAGMVAAPTLENPVLIIIVSMVIGALFGYVSEKVAGMLVSSRTASA